jgi:hypothetical protein
MAKPRLASYDAGEYWTSRDFHTSARSGLALAQPTVAVDGQNMI